MFLNHFRVSYRWVGKKFCEPLQKHPFSQIFLTFWWWRFKNVHFCCLLFIFITISHHYIVHYFFTCVFFPLFEVDDSFSSNSYLFLFFSLRPNSVIWWLKDINLRLETVMNERRWNILIFSKKYSRNIWIFSIEDSRTPNNNPSIEREFLVVREFVVQGIRVV